MFTKEDLLMFNDVLLQRGVPNTKDGIGYNKADYLTCTTYFNGISEAQYADLAKRLVKYSITQLKVDKELMKQTAEALQVVGDRSKGVSIDIREDGTLISFRYNDKYIEEVKKQSDRKWDAESKSWIIPNDSVLDVLYALGSIGADVDNAIEYAKENTVDDVVATIKVVEVKVMSDGDMILLKFDYNKDVIDAVKSIPLQYRQYNSDFKFWAIEKSYFDELKSKVIGVAVFNKVK